MWCGSLRKNSIASIPPSCGMLVYKDSTVAVHFNSKRHNISTLRYIGIEHVKVPRRGGDVNNILLKREAYTLNTLSPKGLNLELDFNCF